MLTGAVLFVVALALRGASANRHVRGRLLGSALIFATYAALTAALAYAGLSPAAHDEARLLAPLLLAFGGINALVALAINPWKADRLPERFPTIVQDSIVITLFAVVAILVLQERVLAATAVSAVVLGFALQDTLGNLFAGLAIQIEKPFRVGHWVNVHGEDGLVSEITWRATKMRTKAGNLVIVPNSVLSREMIVNYSEPVLETRLEVEVGVSYDTPPNRVKAVILDAIRDEPAIVRTHEPEVLLTAFGDSAINYRLRVWTTDFAGDERLKDRLRSAIYYAFHRNGIVIPFPIRTVIMQPHAEAAPDAASTRDALARVPIFGTLPEEQRATIAMAARRVLFAAGESIVRAGDEGSSMFVLLSGEAAVLLEPDRREVARIHAGGFFGEMSLLTGAPRNATVRAAIDSVVIEITADHFRGFVLANPDAVEQIAAAVSRRQAELDSARAAGAPAPAPEAPQRLVDHIRRFLGIATA